MAGLTTIEHTTIQCIVANQWSTCSRGMTKNPITNRLKPVYSGELAVLSHLTWVVNFVRIGLAEAPRNLLGLVGVNWWEPSGWRLSPILSPEYDVRRICLGPRLTYSFAVIPRENTIAPSFKNT
jgi:hypothetical protein